MCICVPHLVSHARFLCPSSTDAHSSFSLFTQTSLLVFYPLFLFSCLFCAVSHIRIGGFRALFFFFCFSRSSFVLFFSFYSLTLRIRVRPAITLFFFFFVQRVSVCRSLLAFYCQTIHTNGAFLFPSPFPLFFYIDVVFIYISDSPFPFSTLLRLLFVFYNLLVTFAFFFLSLSLIATKLVTLI